METSPPESPTGPLTDVRVLEATSGRAGRIAGMLLADLGADVVRALDPGAASEPSSPEALCWDRGKRVAQIPAHDVVPTAGAADILIVDAPTEVLQARGWDRETLSEAHPHLLHLWMPPYGERGEWQDLPEDPLLLAALGTLAVYNPADDDSPVAPVIASLSHLHGAMGAAAAVAALVGRQRLGIARAGVVTGLHAAAAVMGTAFSEIDDSAPVVTSRALTGPPTWRTYRCSDGKSFFLAALTPDLFFRALEAVDRLDLMALPEVGGDFYSIIDLNRGRHAMNEALEAVFASNTTGHWLARLGELRVPCTHVQSRADWMKGPVVAENNGRVDLDHPSLGAVTMPHVPVVLSDTPGAIRGFAAAAPPGAPVWPARAELPAVETAAPAHPVLPLDGVTVVDGSTFLAGPLVATLLADYGADVIKVEAPAGDPYRTYSLSFLAVNQRKLGIVLDLKSTDGVERLQGLLSRADILVENLRPAALAALALDEGSDSPRFPRLVHCSVSAFGRAEAFADAPGFDPIFQCLSGMAVAQGGDGEPTVCMAGANDAATGALGALGSLAALYHRGTTGRGQRVDVSLAMSSTFVQSSELTTWAGSPEPQRGGPLFRGPDDGHRYHECIDGWVAVAAVGATLRARLATALRIDDLADAAAALRGHTVASATSLLAGHDVPVCRVAARPRPLLDPFLEENGFTHLVETSMGTARVVDRHSRWPDAPEPRPGRFFDLGEDADEALAASGGGTDLGERLPTG
jgi:crotonobetainyl-CoA:carnitine CoA-transferase CaiB-like acyl-CoA transferase